MEYQVDYYKEPEEVEEESELEQEEKHRNLEKQMQSLVEQGAEDWTPSPEISEEEDEYSDEDEEDAASHRATSDEDTEGDNSNCEEQSENLDYTNEATEPEQQDTGEEVSSNDSVSEEKEPLTTTTKSGRKRTCTNNNNTNTSSSLRKTRYQGEVEVERQACEAREQPDPSSIESIDDYWSNIASLVENEQCRLADYDPVGFRRFLRAPDLWNTHYARTSIGNVIFKLSEFGLGSCYAGKSHERQQEILDYFFSGEYKEPRLDASVTLTPVSRAGYPPRASARHTLSCEVCGMANREVSYRWDQFNWWVGSDCANKLELLGDIVHFIARIRYEVCENPEILQEDELLEEIWFQLCRYDADARELLESVQFKYRGRSMYK
jgi:hypothetical protein